MREQSRGLPAIAYLTWKWADTGPCCSWFLPAHVGMLRSVGGARVSCMTSPHARGDAPNMSIKCSAPGNLPIPLPQKHASGKGLHFHADREAAGKLRVLLSSSACPPFLRSSRKDWSFCAYKEVRRSRKESRTGEPANTASSVACHWRSGPPFTGAEKLGALPSVAHSVRWARHARRHLPV